MTRPPTAAGLPQKQDCPQDSRPKRNGNELRGGGLEGGRYPWGDGIDATKANYLAPGRSRSTSGTARSDRYPPNALGVFDCAGNVWEWVSDWYRADCYQTEGNHNPRGPAAGTLRVVRGGAWTNDDPDYLRCARRLPVPPDTYSYSIGFRIACADDGRVRTGGPEF
jgi:sulfatase modifying factor 1